MPASTASFPVDEILLAAAQELRDNDMNRLGRPFYMSAAQRGLSEMNSQTHFHKKTWSADVPSNLVLQLPEGLTEKDGVYLYNEQDGNILSSTILWIKPNMWHTGNGGYISNNKGRNRDALQFSASWSETPPSHLYFAGERDGVLYMSPGCLKWQKVHVAYTGIGMDCFGDDFRVPHWCREAITDFVILRAALALEREDPQRLGRVINRKEAEMKTPAGSWWTAVGRYKPADKKGRSDSTAYNFGFGHTP